MAARDRHAAADVLERLKGIVPSTLAGEEVDALDVAEGDGPLARWTLTASSVLLAFDRARLSGHPLLSLRELIDEVERPSIRRIKDLFTPRNRELVGTLIVEDGRGRYRLNLPVSSKSAP